MTLRSQIPEIGPGVAAPSDRPVRGRRRARLNRRLVRLIGRMPFEGRHGTLELVLRCHAAQGASIHVTLGRRLWAQRGRPATAPPRSRTAPDDDARRTRERDHRFTRRFVVAAFVVGPPGVALAVVPVLR